MEYTMYSPLAVSYGGIFTEIGQQFLETVGQVDESRPGDESRDATDFHNVNVFNVRNYSAIYHRYERLA